MSKLAPKDKFLDLSDYARPFGKLLANALAKTRFTPIHVTILFGISGVLAVYYIIENQFFAASFFIVLKSGIDAADGELARLKGTPSYVGRYLDSVFDIILNFMLLMAICFVSKTHFWPTMLAFFGIQFQGTLYHYYYVIVRNKSVGGDATSKIFEHKAPRALPGETQRNVNILFYTYTFFYGIFDSAVHFLDADAFKVKSFPKWFMTFLSMYGLGFQLLIIAVLLPLGLIEYIIPFFIYFTVLMFVIIGFRKVFLKV